MRMHITLNVNAKQRGVEPEPSVILLDVRREHLDLTGSKNGATRARAAAIASSSSPWSNSWPCAPAHAARSGSRTLRTAPRSHTPAQLFRQAAASSVAAWSSTAHQKGAFMSAINSQSHGDVGDEDLGAHDSSGEAMVTEQLIAQVLRRAHRKAVANNAPDEARALLHVAHSFADALEANPRFDRLRFIGASTESVTRSSA
jgi:hypothetical protein